jgi:hypothetical protein
MTQRGPAEEAGINYVEDIIDLLSFCLNTTYVVFEGCYCQQVFGTAMGSPESAVIANLVMEDVEQRTLASVRFGNVSSMMSSLRFLEMKSIFCCNI